MRALRRRLAFDSGHDDLEEGELELPSLDLDPQALTDERCRRTALRRLDDLLEKLERANLADLAEPPPSVMRELIEAGLPDPLSYTIPQLIEIVFKTQRPLMRANPDAWSRLLA